MGIAFVLFVQAGETNLNLAFQACFYKHKDDLNLMKNLPTFMNYKTVGNF